MSIEHDGFNGHVVYCDFCSNDLACPDTDYHETVAIAKSEGWKVCRDDTGGWDNVCPVCAEKWSR